MIAKGKITKIFCLVDDFCQHFASELKKSLLLSLMSVADKIILRKMALDLSMTSLRTSLILSIQDIGRSQIS